MRTLAFDGRMGASGDMLLASLLAVGGDPSVLRRVEAALDVRYAVSETTRNGIVATRVDVVRGDAERNDDAPKADADVDDAVTGHQPATVDDHHDHDHHDHDHVEGGGPDRTYEEVVALVRGMELPSVVTENALAIFRLLGEAEGTVHGTSLDDTHFHEVGADDAIADVVGVCLLLDDIDADRVVTTPLSAGGGSVEMRHGTYPIPAPAVVELAGRADWAVQGGPVDAELLTPTGAAILAHVADGVEHLPSLAVERSGYGAGGWTFEDHPNVLRALVGDGGSRLVREEITVLETNLDDASPEVLGSLQETLQAVGARDVSILPTTMKKSRPGHLVKVVVRPEDAEHVARRLAEETGTLGIREHGVGHRWTARRRFETATLDDGDERFEVTVKVASDVDGAVYDYSAEYEDALAMATATGLPVREVMRRAEHAVRERSSRG